MRSPRPGLDVTCPRCHAAPGYGCVTGRGRRTHPHTERLAASHELARADLEAEVERESRAAREAIDDA